MPQRTVKLRITGDFVEEISSPLSEIYDGDEISWVVEDAGGREIKIVFLGPFAEPLPRTGSLSGTVAAVRPHHNYKVFADETALNWKNPPRNFATLPISSGPPPGGASQTTGNATS